MKTHSMKLVTIVTEALARKPVEALLNQVGAHGFTVFSVEGQGARGERAADISEYANIQIQVVVPPAIADQLLARLTSDFFPCYGMIAYETDVRVCRLKTVNGYENRKVKIGDPHHRGCCWVRQWIAPRPQINS